MVGPRISSFRLTGLTLFIVEDQVERDILAQLLIQSNGWLVFRVLDMSPGRICQQKSHQRKDQKSRETICKLTRRLTPPFIHLSIICKIRLSIKPGWVCSISLLKRFQGGKAIG